MFRNLWCAAAFAVAASASLPVRAQDSDVAKLREEMRQLQQRMQALEKKLQDAEDRASRAQESATQAENTAAQAATQASSRAQAENALNPGLSAILNGVYANLKKDPTGFRMNGFVPTLGDVSPGLRGFSLGESEIGLSANIDPWFRGTLIAAIAPAGGIEVEEGYLQTLNLSHGLTVKAGRFFSAVGYQNEAHAHAWDFTDAPLAMKVFLGNQRNDDGVQFKWVAPTNLYFDVGLELGRGHAFPISTSGGRNKNGVGSTNLFAHLGGDLGASTAWQAGLSYLAGRADDRRYSEFDSAGNTLATNSFTGSTRLWVAGGILKWSPNGNPTYASFKLQGEYFRRSENGNLTYNVDPASATSATAAAVGTVSDSMKSRQSGWYLQGVYQFLPAWRFGFRYDKLDSGATTLGLIDSGVLTAADLPILGAYNPKRYAAMIDWTPSEFSRVRLQLARDYSRIGDPDNQLFLQYIVSLGAHGAHKF